MRNFIIMINLTWGLIAIISMLMGYALYDAVFYATKSTIIFGTPVFFMVVYALWQAKRSNTDE